MQIPINLITEQFNAINSIFSPWDNPNSPGCIIGILDQDELVYSRGFGSANLEHAIPITDETVFRIASVSKQFTAACFVLLEEAELISLDDYILQYFPEFPDIFKEIKIIHLLNHTSGLRDYLWLFNFAGYSFQALDLVDEQVFLDMIIRQKSLNFKPGSQFMYSNTGYVFLALLVKRVTGLSLREYADKNIFTPLQMNNTHFIDDHRFIMKNRAEGYTVDTNKNFVIYETSNELVGDGAVFTTLKDMVKWAENFTMNRLGKKLSSFNDKLTQPGVLTNGQPINYALGLRITSHKGLKQIYHAGMIAGFRAAFVYFPEENLKLICFANVATINPENVCNKIIDLFLKDKIQNRVIPENDLEETIDTSNLNQFCGYYRNIEKKQIYFASIENGLLVSELYAVNPLNLYSKTIYKHIATNVFKRKSGLLEPDLEFIRNGSSQWSKFIAHDDNGEKITFERIAIPEISSEQLQKYCGRYYSEELDTYYTIECGTDHLEVIIKRVEKIQLQYSIVSEYEFTRNQAYIKFIEDSKGVYKFELSTLRVPKPIIFVKEEHKNQKQ